MTGRACAAPGCSRPLPPGRRRFCCDLCRVRGQRAERRYDAGEFGMGVLRMIRALARRAGASDLAEFGVLWELRAEADRAAVAAVDELRAKGFSWAEIAAEAGLSPQGMQQWRKRRPAPPGVNGPLKREGAP